MNDANDLKEAYKLLFVTLVPKHKIKLNKMK